MWDTLIFEPTDTGDELQPVTATQSSTHNNDDHRYGAANCIDGDTDSDVGPDGLYAICLTLAGTKPWFAIDYGTSVAVQRVEIFNRGTHGGRTRNVEVRISNELPTSSSEMFSGGNLLGSFAGPAVDGQHIVISGEK